MKNKIQNSEFILKGGLGSININGKESKIIASKSDYMKGSLTLTIIGSEYFRLNNCSLTEDIECEVIPPKAIGEGKEKDKPSVATEDK